MSHVFVSIVGPHPSLAERRLELGEFHAVWRPGVTIGSDPACTLVLPELASIAARVVAASNHKMLYLLPEGTSFDALPPPSPLPPGGQRIDYRPFGVGPYRICFGEGA